ncbi:hypothetical protein P4K96_30680 [Bacillus cereus]|nr:hypothetical protein [Bacillus cereus]
MVSGASSDPCIGAFHMNLISNKKLLLQKVYTVSKKHKSPRLFFQHLVCETAGFTPGEDLFVRVDNSSREIIVQNRPFDEKENVHEITVSSRVNRINREPRPLLAVQNTHRF